MRKINICRLICGQYCINRACFIALYSLQNVNTRGLSYYFSIPVKLTDVKMIQTKYLVNVFTAIWSLISKLFFTQFYVNVDIKGNYSRLKNKLIKIYSLTK